MMMEEELTFEILLGLVKEAVSEIKTDQIDNMIDHCLRAMEEEETRLNEDN